MARPFSKMSEEKLDLACRRLAEGVKLSAVALEMEVTSTSLAQVIGNRACKRMAVTGNTRVDLGELQAIVSELPAIPVVKVLPPPPSHKPKASAPIQAGDFTYPITDEMELLRLRDTDIKKYRDGFPAHVVGWVWPEGLHTRNRTQLFDVARLALLKEVDYAEVVLHTGLSLQEVVGIANRLVGEPLVPRSVIED